MQLVGRGDRDLQEPQLEQFERGQALAAGQLAGFADVAIVEADDAKAARRELRGRTRRPNGSSGRRAP